MSDRRAAARRRVLAVVIATLIPATVVAGGWAAFLTLRTASPAELTASSALGRIDKIRLVDSVIHLQGRTLYGRCLTGRFSTLKFRHAVHAEFASLSNGARLLDIGFGPHDLADTLQPEPVVRAEWALAGCSGVLRGTIGKALALRLPVAVSPVQRGRQRLLRIVLPLGEPSTSYLFQPVTGMPRRMEYSTRRLSGWSALYAVRADRSSVRAMIKLLHLGQIRHRQHQLAERRMGLAHREQFGAPSN
jgi:hypothetical protein